jgi:purine-binding chemotaxis protein CheW
MTSSGGQQQTGAGTESTTILPAVSGSEDENAREGRREGEQDFLCFRIGGRLFATPVANVIEVVPLTTVVAVPHAPSHIPGIFNRHGRVTAVLDLALCLQESAETKPTRIIVFQSGELQAGVPVDEIVGIHAFVATDLRAALPGMAKLGEGVRGHFLHEERAFVVLDLVQLLENFRTQ